MTTLPILAPYANTLQTIVLPRHVDMRDAALDELRELLADARADRDRAQSRCVELELRLEVIREVCR